MKIGILTFHQAINFGAVLQAYALSTAASKLGAEVEIVNYKSEFLAKHYEPVNWKIILKPKQLAILLIKNGPYVDNKETFIEFKKKYLKLSKEYNIKNINETNAIYDNFITGSDQVWSYYVAGFDKTYFLDFVSEDMKKNSYAASFGVSNIPDIHHKEYRKLLGQFNRISVREAHGKKIIKDICERSAQLVLDPTLLLDKSEWQLISSSSEFEEEKYLLLYLLAETKEILDLARNIAKDKKLKVIYINDRLYKRHGMINNRKTSPEEFVNLFLNASYVVTNSFHGLCFAINFNKDFNMQYLPGKAKVNSRLENILNTFELHERVIDKVLDSKNTSSINYQVVNEILQNERQLSMEFLKGIITFKGE